MKRREFILKSTFAGLALSTATPLLSVMADAAGANTTPKGWEEGKEGLIYLRVQLLETAAAPIYLTGNVGWRYPRRLFSFTLGSGKLPVF